MCQRSRALHMNAEHRSWPTTLGLDPLLFRAFDQGVDLVMRHSQSTPEASGERAHGRSDLRARSAVSRLKDMTRVLGLGVSADEASLVSCAACRRWRCARGAFGSLGAAGSKMATRTAGGCRSASSRFARSFGPRHLETWTFARANGVFSFLLAAPHAGRESAFIDALRPWFKIGAAGAVRTAW